MPTTSNHGAPHGAPMVQPCLGVRLPSDVEAAAERAVPGTQVVAHSIEHMLAHGRLPNNASLFWRAGLARHAVVLVMARRRPGERPTREGLRAMGLAGAAVVTTDAALAAAAERLGLLG